MFWLKLTLTFLKKTPETKFKGFLDEGAGCELEAKNCFQGGSFKKYLRQTLVFMSNSALREKFNF